MKTVKENKRLLAANELLMFLATVARDHPPLRNGFNALAEVVEDSRPALRTIKMYQETAENFFGKYVAEQENEV